MTYRIDNIVAYGCECEREHLYARRHRRIATNPCKARKKRAEVEGVNTLAERKANRFICRCMSASRK